MLKFLGGAVVIWLAVIAFVASCWIANLVQLIDLDFEAPYKAEIVHGIGLVPFVSCVTAFVDIEDGKPVKEEDKNAEIK